MDKISEMMIKMSHIGVINMMEDKIGKNVSSFKELEKYTLENLEELRDNLVVEYNDVINARKFAAEMIYNRKPKNHKLVPLKSQSDYDNEENIQELDTQCSKDPDKCESIPPGDCGPDCHGYDEMYFVNKSDWQDKFWRNNYHIWLTAQGIQFCVNADCTKDALDFIMDYCVENNMAGLYSKERLQDDEYVTAGNFGYQFTTHNIRLEIID